MRIRPFTNQVKFIPKDRRGRFEKGQVYPADHFEVSATDIAALEAGASANFINPDGGGEGNSEGGGSIQIEDLVPAIKSVSPTENTTLILNEVTTNTQQLTVSADANLSDPALLAYQWEQSTDGGSTWTALTGETGTTYTIPSGLDFATNDNEKYRCEITHPNVVNSPQYTGITTLDIKRTITISTQPTLVGGSANNGSTTTFTVTGSITSGTIDYQWQYKAVGTNTWSDITNATTNSYTTGTLDINTNTDDQYRVVLSNAEANSVTSSVVTLVIAGADFRVQPSINDIEFWDLAENGPLIFDPSNSPAYTITSLNTARSKFSAKMWGQGSCSSEGGHSYGEIPATAGDVFAVNLNAGRGVASNGQHGGGYAGIFDGTVSQANALMIAGGAGSGGDDGTDTCGNDGGDGGGTSGGDGTDESANLTGGAGGTQSAGGTAGVASGAATGTSFSQTYTSSSTITIPANVLSVNYTIHGSKGSVGGNGTTGWNPPSVTYGGQGARGQKLTGVLTGVGGETLDISINYYTGGTGGPPGTGSSSPGFSGAYGGAGGAASVIRIGSTTLATAGGGGGGGGGGYSSYVGWHGIDGLTSTVLNDTLVNNACGNGTNGYGWTNSAMNSGGGGGGGGCGPGDGGAAINSGNLTNGEGGYGGEGYYNTSYHTSVPSLQTPDSDTSYIEISYVTLGSDGTDGAALQGGNGGSAGSAEGQDLFDTPGTDTWTCPQGVTSVCVVCIGGGAGGGNSTMSSGGGGGLGYKNNISVTPGQSYTVVVGAGGNAAGQTYPVDRPLANGNNGGDSYFISTSTVKGGGGTPTSGGSYVGDGGGYGGTGGSAGGGGGAGGYSGNGGTSGSNGTGGGAGGGYAPSGFNGGGGGGGTGVYGEGSSGAAGTSSSRGGKGGSGGEDGYGWTSESGSAGGQEFGGGGGAGAPQNSVSASFYRGGGQGGYGAVRIIWGTGRSFPSTNTADQTSPGGAGGAGGGGYFGGGGGSAGNTGTAGGGGGSGYVDSTLSNAATSAFAASSDTDRGTAGSVDSDSRVVINDTFISITQQPAGAVVTQGNTHTFTVTASVNDLASPTINYQWQKKISGTWTDISGATNSSYTTPAITSSDNNTLFRCNLSNEFCSDVTSDQAVLLTSSTGTTTYSLTTTGLTNIPLTDATEFSFKIWGAGGGGTGEGCGGPYSGGAGGFGAKTVTVPTGDTSSLSVFVGATGLGDTAAGLTGYGAGRGGQRTYISWVPTGSGSAFEWIAGGGGGAGQAGNGGGGGGIASGSGGNGSGPNAGSGASTSGGGGGGSSNGGNNAGTGIGGNSGGGVSGGSGINQGNRGGGGGSGYFGGGGGAGDNTGNNCTGGGAGGGSGATFEPSFSGVTISNSLSQNGSNGSGSGAAAPYNTDSDYVQGRGSNGNDGLAVVSVTIPGGLQMTGVNTNTITEIKNLSSTTTLTEPVYINAQDQNYDVTIRLRGNSPGGNGGDGQWVRATVRMNVGEIFLLHYDTRYAAVFYGSSAIANNCALLAAEGGYQGNPRSESGAGGLPRPSEPDGGNAGYNSGYSGTSLNGSGGGGGGTTSGYRSGTGGGGGAKGGDLSASAGSAGGFFSAGSGGGGVDGNGGAGGFGYYGGGGGGGGWDTGVSYGAYFGGGGGGGSSYIGGLPSPSSDSNSPAEVVVTNTSYGYERGSPQIQIISVAAA